MNPKFLVIDLFCGAGGTTTGFEMAKHDGNKLAEIMACVNHDAKAIKSHWLNHPNVEHYEEDITKMYGAVQSFKIYGNHWHSIFYNPLFNGDAPHEVYNVFFKSPEMVRLERLVDIYRACYPEAKIILWASLECTNFSKAKGGQARDADSRTLADHLDRYIMVLDPDYIQIENVVEFMSWGPLDENGKPISKKSGADYLRWCKHIDSIGYTNQWKELNSADFGAYTSRNRLFGCFAKPGLPVIWPEPTHAKKIANTQQGLFGAGLEKWKPVKDVLDFEDEGTSIFNRKKDLSPKTLERIYAGLIKYVAGGKDAFILKYNSTSQDGKHSPPSVDEPCPTIACQNRLGMCFIAKSFSGRPAGKVIPVTGPAGTITTVGGQSLVQPFFLVQRNSGNPNGRVISLEGPARTLTATGGNQDLVQPKFMMNYHHSSDVNSLENPCPTLTTRDKLAVINPSFLTKYYSGDAKNMIASLEGPSPTIRTKDGTGLVQCFLTHYYGSGGQFSSIENPAPTIPTKARSAKIWLDKTYSGKDNHQSIEQPAGTIMTNDKHQLIQTAWLDRNFSTGGQHSSIDSPAGSLLAVPKLNLVNAEPFILNGNFGHTAPVKEPAPTLCASRRHHYIVNPSHGGHSTSVDAPCPVIIARQDKAPLYLIEASVANVLIPIYEDDPEVMKDIKLFMAMYGISDIKMRMLKVPELLKIQGFPDDYQLFGNQSDQKKFIGNSVHPFVPKAWCEAMSDGEITRAKAA